MFRMEWSSDGEGGMDISAAFDGYFEKLKRSRHSNIGWLCDISSYNLFVVHIDSYKDSYIVQSPYR